MPRKCAICQFKDRKKIDDQIVNNLAFAVIARQTGFTKSQVADHANKHVLPFVKSANEQAQASIVERVTQYRMEVNLPPLEKAKKAQERLFNELEATTDRSELVMLLKELRGWNIEEAKLTGAYQKERENDFDLAKVARQIAYVAHEKKRDPVKEVEFYIECMAESGERELLIQKKSQLLDEVLKETEKRKEN